jgi:predicted  nucleic acid-binding Zn-ribbon protein
VLCLTFCVTALPAATPTIDEIWELLQRQQRELDTLKAERQKEQQTIERLKEENEQLKDQLQATEEKVERQLIRCRSKHQVNPAARLRRGLKEPA